jgi:beta-glucosidase
MLRGFARISLQPGETKAVTFNLPASKLAIWDEKVAHNFVVEPGKCDILVGASSADIRAQGRIEVVR